MPERWLSQLQKIDRVEPTYGLLERAEAGPLLPEPGPRPTARAGAVIVAALVAVAGIWGAFAALRGVGDADGVAGEDTGAFEALWPETSFAEAQQVQERVNAGDPAVQWRTDAAEVAIRYAKEVLGWPDPIAGISATDDPDTVTVSLFGPIASCTGAECETQPQPQQIGLHLNLRRLVSPGEGGIWSVAELGPVSQPIGEDRPRIGVGPRTPTVTG